jgi:hypothetical protein
VNETGPEISAPGTLADTAEKMVVVRDTVAPDTARGAELLDGYQRLVRALADRGWLDATLAQQVLGSVPVDR